MKYNSSIANKNIVGVSIAGHPFKTLRQAEIYCDKHELDPNWISEDIAECKRMANESLPELERIRELLSDERDEVYKQLNIIATEMNSLKEKHDILSHIDLEIAKEKHIRLHGMLLALSAFSEKMFDRHNDLTSIRNASRNRTA